jgi:hypothetical protein
LTPCVAFSTDAVNTGSLDPDHDSAGDLILRRCR